MKEEYISYKELLKRKEDLNRLRNKGFKLVYGKNRFKRVCGFVCLSVAIFPNGLGIIAFPIGFYLLGIGLKEIQIYKDNLRFRLWLRLNK